MTDKETPWTKGPWEVDGPPYNQIVWSSGQSRVCFMAHSDGTDTKRDIANARLIAAAPDLYEALAEIMKAEDEDGVGWARAAVKARAALVRAQGDAA